MQRREGSCLAGHPPAAPDAQEAVAVLPGTGWLVTRHMCWRWAAGGSVHALQVSTALSTPRWPKHKRCGSLVCCSECCAPEWLKLLGQHDPTHAEPTLEAQESFASAGERGAESDSEGSFQTALEIRRRDSSAASIGSAGSGEVTSCLKGGWCTLATGCHCCTLLSGVPNPQITMRL